MNKKLIAVAVASALAAPAVHADITPYGRINNAIDINDVSDDFDNENSNNVDLSGVASRFGFKGSGDIGNGMTAIGRYEFSTTTDKEGNGVEDTRLAYVGLSGGFGTVTMGNQWSAYYNSVGTYLSPTYSLGYFLYSSVSRAPFRASNTVKYANSFGAVNMEIDLRLNDSNEGNDVAEKLNGNGAGIGLSWMPMDAFTLAFAYDQDEDEPDADTGITPEDEKRMGITGKYDFGPVAAMLGYQEYEQGTDKFKNVQTYFSGPIGEKTSWLAGYGETDVEDPGTANDGRKPSQYTLGLYHNMGGGLRLWAEYASIDYDNFDERTGKTKQALLGMRIDF